MLIVICLAIISCIVSYFLGRRSGVKSNEDWNSLQNRLHVILSDEEYNQRMLVRYYSDRCSKLQSVISRYRLHLPTDFSIFIEGFWHV